MKKIFLLLFVLVFANAIAFSQGKSDSAIGYTGGFEILYSTINKKIHSGINPTQAENTNSYYSAILTIEKDGSISSINLSSVNSTDSSEIPIILQTIKLTDKKWINNSNEIQYIVLPIYYLFTEDDSKEKKVINISQVCFVNEKKIKLTYLKPITVFVYPTVH